MLIVVTNQSLENENCIFGINSNSRKVNDKGCQLILFLIYRTIHINSIYLKINENELQICAGPFTACF